MTAHHLDLYRARFAWPRLSVRGVIARILQADALYRERQALSNLDDRLLDDIGVNRADVAKEMRRPLF